MGCLYLGTGGEGWVACTPELVEKDGLSVSWNWLRRIGCLYPGTV